MRRLKTLRRPPIYPKTQGHLPCSSLTHPLPLSSRRPSVSFGGFGLKRNSAVSPRSAILHRFFVSIRGPIFIEASFILIPEDPLIPEEPHPRSPLPGPGAKSCPTQSMSKPVPFGLPIAARTESIPQKPCVSIAIDRLKPGYSSPFTLHILNIVSNLAFSPDGNATILLCGRSEDRKA